MKTLPIAALCISFLINVTPSSANNVADAEAALAERLQQLEDRIEDMQSSSQDHWLSQRRAAEIRSLVSDVLADADSRTNLLQGGVTLSHNGRYFSFGTADGNIKLNIEGQVQVRFSFNHQDSSPDTLPLVGNGDDDRWSFENRRTKLAFHGHAVDPSWMYYVNMAFSRSSGSAGLEDAWIAHKLDNGVTLKAGQFKAPLLHEELTSSKRQLAVDRSVVNAVYTLARSQGLSVSQRGEQFGWNVAYTDGSGTANTAALAEDTEFAVTARLDALVTGDWGQFKDFTSPQGSANGIRVGGAVHYQVSEYGTGLGTGVAPSFNDAEIESLTLTGDAQAEFDGANIFGAVIYRSLETDVSGGTDADQIAVLVQGGYYFTPDVEAFARYEWSDLDTTGLDDISILTIGVNKYFASHSAKWTTDIGFGFDSVPVTVSGAGWRADGSDDGQVVVRTQWQLLF